MPEPIKQVDKFLEELGEIKSDSVVLDDKSVSELFEKPKEPSKTEEVKSDEDEEDKPKTRRYKRLEKKNEEMSQMLIEMNDRIKKLSELERYAKEHEGETDPDMVKVFGTDDNGKILTKFFSDKFKDIEENAKKNALEQIAQDNARASEQEKIESDTIDQAFDTLEEKFNVDLSGKNKASREFRNGFIDFVEQLSPKDSEGNIIEYADFNTAFETYSKISSNNKPRETSDRQKELASRGMTNSGKSVPEIPKGPMNFNRIHQMIDSMRNQQH